MIEEKINLQWGKFTWQLGLCLIALLGGIYASLYFFVPEEAQVGIAKTDVGLILGYILTVGIFSAALYALRVPYKKDMFERRLRNWSMTYASMIIFSLSVPINIAFHLLSSRTGEYNNMLITPYMMPAMWLVCYIIYSQYTRYCIVHDRRNRFTDGSKC